MIGKFGAYPWVSLMSAAQPRWESSGSIDRPIAATFRLSNSGFRRATEPSSVVQTGVKSRGCEKRMAQRSPIHSWNRIGPSVVSAMKSGAASPSLSDMSSSVMRWCPPSARGAALAAGRNADDVIREARRGVEAQHRRGVRDEVGRGVDVVEVHAAVGAADEVLDAPDVD